MLRIAVACSGLGHVQRGFEAFAQDLFSHLRSSGEVEVTVFKGGGTALPDEVPVWNIPRSSSLWGILKEWVDPYVAEQITFALMLVRRLKRERFDIVHISDGQAGAIIRRFSTGASQKYRILFTNGGPLSPEAYERFDYIQQVNPIEFDRALGDGLPPERMTLLPYGVSVSRFNCHKGKTVEPVPANPDGSPLVISVGAHGTHKRFDFLIKHMAEVEESFNLLIVGEESPSETPRLRALAHHLLGDKISFVTLPHKLMPAVYTSADLYVHTSLREGFGLTFLEAMASGLPIIHHDEPGMNWVVGDGGVAVDMTVGDSLSRTVNEVLRDSVMRSRLGRRARKRAEKRFSWGVLLPMYIRMYEEAVRMPLSL